MLMIQGLMCENSSKAWRDIKKARLWFWRLFEVSYLRWNLTLIIASLTSAQSPLPSPPGFEVMTGHLLCGTRHLLSSVPCKARKINLHSANERLVNVCPEKTFFLYSFSLSHTHTTMSWKYSCSCCWISSCSQIYFPQYDNLKTII